MERYTIRQHGGLVCEGEPDDIVRRYEKIPTMIFPSSVKGSEWVAERIIAAIAAAGERTFVLGLTTGRTPAGIYRKLLEANKAGRVSFRNVALFSLDEFYPIEQGNMQSRNLRIREELVDHIDIDPSNVHLLDGAVPQSRVTEYCREYEKSIEQAGGIDLMLLGTGEQGQLGFNEPGSFVNSRTRLVALSNATRQIQSTLFAGDTPSRAITMGLGTVLDAREVLLVAWGEDKAPIVGEIVEGEPSRQNPASCLQRHHNITVLVDKGASAELTRVRTPWLVGTCDWQPKFVRKAVLWLCGKVGKPILKLTRQDYIDNGLAQLLDARGDYYGVNIEVFNDLQHTITGWPGGKPDADDSTRPESSAPFPKRVLIFSPHPDDDVISMGGTFLRLVDQGHDVHVAYQTSGNIAVNDDVVLQTIDTAQQCGFAADKDDAIRRIIATRDHGAPQPAPLLSIKGAIRRGEARAACVSFGLNADSNCHFLNLPFYETGGVKKGRLTDADIDIIVELLRRLKPDRIYAAGDLSDPHGTHRVSIEAVLQAVERVQDDEWMRGCRMWLYRGAWQEWGLDMVDMAVPLSPDEVVKKRHAIYRHLSQKDIVPFPGEDKREFWQRAEERTQNTAREYDRLGMAEYQAMEVFVRLF